MTHLLLGLGTAVPPHMIPQQQAASIAKAFGRYTAQQERLLEALFRRARVQQRASVLLEPANGHGPTQSFFAPARDQADRGPTTQTRLKRYAQEAPPLAHAAAARALGDAALDPSVITHLVTVSCTGFIAPGVDIRLINTLGLRPDVERTHVGFMGCHGALNGLRVAGALAASRPGARVLVCAVELCSLHFRYGWDEEGLVANSLFADGAAACVIASRASEANDASEMRGANAAGTIPPLSLRAGGSVVLPDSEQAMGWSIGDHGFEMRLDPSVPELISRHLRPWLSQWLAAHGLSLERVGSWALHPGGPRILQSVVEGLGLPQDVAAVSRQVLSEYGNMSSPTILFILERLRRIRAPGPYVALAFGPGLAAETALLDV